MKNCICRLVLARTDFLTHTLLPFTARSFPPPEVKGDISISWLYEEIASQWGYWLPEDAVETLR